MPQPIKFESFFTRPRHTPQPLEISRNDLPTGYCWSGDEVAVPDVKTALWVHYGINPADFATAVHEEAAVLSIPVDDITLEGEPEGIRSWEWYYMHRETSRWITYALHAADRRDLFVGQCLFPQYRGKLESLVCLLISVLPNPYFPIIWATEHSGRVLSAWRYACIQNHTPDHLKIETESVMARLGQPYELWAAGMSYCAGVMHCSFLNIIPAGEHRRKHTSARINVETEEMRYTPACPHHVCLFWRDFPGDNFNSACDNNLD